MRLHFFVLIGSLAAAVNSAPLSIPYTVHEKRDVTASSSKWQRLDVKLDRRSTIPMSIALTQRNLESGLDFLMDVSNPASANYGKHWSANQV